MRANEQEVKNTLNANTENIKSEVKKLENQIIETATRLLTSYQIFLNNAKESANNEISTNKTQAINNITEAKNTANNEISANKTESLETIKEQKQQATRDYWLYCLKSKPIRAVKPFILNSHNLRNENR
ncbi:hypothetical protein VN0416_09450 [Helicobacter pylori]